MDMNTMIDVITDVYVNTMMENESLANNSWRDTLPYVLMRTDERIIRNEASMFSDVMENIDANFDLDDDDSFFYGVNTRMMERAYERMLRLRRERSILN